MLIYEIHVTVRMYADYKIRLVHTIHNFIKTKVIYFESWKKDTTNYTVITYVYEKL